jgi:CheY-like chemotaxis protein
VILIVEDDPQVARLIALVLQRNGYEGTIVDNGEAALRVARESVPQLVFADLHVKGMTGQALCSALKKEPKTSSIPFVVLSGDRDIEEKARVCGADDHLGKPFEFEDLIRLVRKHAKAQNDTAD